MRWMLATGALLLASNVGVAAEDARITVELEAGPAWFSRNDARIPNDSGTRFDLLDLTGSGPEAYVRLHGSYAFDDRHSLRVTLAPVEADGRDRLGRDVRFQDALFSSEDDIQASYQFNTYRLSYRYMVERGEPWEWGIGATLLVRDAEIQLRQGDLRRTEDDTGLVPLLHLFGKYRLNERSALIVDFEGLAASQGRAFDMVVKYQYELPSGWFMSAGYRSLEGGTDDELYSFAWLHFAAFSLGYRF